MRGNRAASLLTAPKASQSRHIGSVLLRTMFDQVLAVLQRDLESCRVTANPAALERARRDIPRRMTSSGLGEEGASLPTSSDTLRYTLDIVSCCQLPHVCSSSELLGDEAELEGASAALAWASGEYRSTDFSRERQLGLDLTTDAHVHLRSPVSLPLPVLWTSASHILFLRIICPGNSTIAPALAAGQAGPHYYGFVTGGRSVYIPTSLGWAPLTRMAARTPISLAADSLVSSYDANVQVHLPVSVLLTE